MQSTTELIQKITPTCDLKTKDILSLVSQDNFPNNDPLPVSFSGRRFAAYIETLMGSFISPTSQYHQSPILLKTIHHLIDLLTNACNPDGTLNSGNFASPPDTAFVVPPMGSVLRALKHHAPEQTNTITHIEHFLKRIGEPLITGGIHTPNHRWVVCSALSYLYHFFNDPRYLSRIDQWLSEGIDIDPDGHVSERSTATYAHVTTDALIRTSTLLNRAELLEPIRKCLSAMIYFFRLDGTIETTASRRQDQHQNPSGNRWYLDYRFMAIHDNNDLFATQVRALEQTQAHLTTSTLIRLFEEPVLMQPISKTESLPTPYHIFHKHSGIARIRTKNTDATIFAGCDDCGPPVSGLARNPTFFRLQKGDAHLCSVRIAPMFFSCGYMQASNITRNNNTYHFNQTMTISYFQPFDPKHHHPQGQYDLTSAEDRYYSCMNFPLRDRANVQSLTFNVTIKQHEETFEIDLNANGPKGVPIAIEFAFPKTGTLSNVSPAQDHLNNIHFLTSGTGSYTHQNNTLIFGPGNHAHQWHPFLTPTGFHWPPDEPNTCQYVYIPFLTPTATIITIA